MNDTMTLPELGSKISLVSKADIRYEGRLFTVDPQECTIALANGKFKSPRSETRLRFKGENICETRARERSFVLLEVKGYLSPSAALPASCS